MACINPNSPEFKAALERTGGNPLLAEIEVDRGQQIKPGVDELFSSTPELASIGTPEQYSQYLDTIFPDSKVEEIDNSLYISVLESLKSDKIIDKQCS